MGLKPVRFLSLSIALLSLQHASFADACSVVEGYRIPTNLELASGAELILRGEVVGEIEGEQYYENSILIRPIEAIKGDLPQDNISVPFTMLFPQPNDEVAVRVSNPFELEYAQLSSMGECSRSTFMLGSKVLFFLVNQEKAWVPAGGPYSRWAEDVLVEEGPWLALTRLYVEASKMSDEARVERLVAERENLSQNLTDPVAQLMAQDISRQLRGLNSPILEAEDVEELNEPSSDAVTVTEGPDEYSLTGTITISDSNPPGEKSE